MARGYLAGGNKVKNAPIQPTYESAPDKRDYTPGTLPKRIDTVISSVLAALLESKELTGMESVFKQSTTRLGAAVHYLEHHYGWHIERRDMAVGTADGRIPYITAYWLKQAKITQAFENGARKWIESVNVARAERRKKSGECKAKAQKINAARQRNQDPRQSNLWG